MSEPKMKANCSDHIDRISGLPGNVIDGILQHMNIRDIVGTSILSRKWRYMWISAPRLEFGEEFYDLYQNLDDTASEFSRTITEILLLHNGLIDQFILHLSWVPDYKITYQHLNKWILFLSRKGVKHIQLINNEYDIVQIPSHLFSCQESTYFKLDRFNLSIPPGFGGFESLRRLHLLSITFELGALQTLVSGCLLLQELAILYCTSYECINLSSCSSTLIDLALTLRNDSAFCLEKSLPNIQRLTLESVGKMLQYANIFPLSYLISLKYLRIDGVNLDEREELLYIVDVLKSASNLVELELVIKSDNDNDYEIQTTDPLEKLECSGCCLSQLQKVYIRVGNSIKRAMSLTWFILARSASLKTLTFDVIFGIKPDAPILSSISRDLLWMERASRRAHVEFIHE